MIASIPPNPPAPVAKLAAEWERLRASANDRSLDDLRDQMDAAEKTDREAHAVALRRGKPDPGSPKVDALKAQIAEAERRSAGFSEAAATVEAELDQAIRAAAQEWLATSSAAIADLAVEIQHRIDELQALYTQARDVAGTLAFLDNYDQMDRHHYKPGRLPVAGLRGQNDEPIPIATLLLACRHSAEQMDPTIVPDNPWSNKLAVAAMKDRTDIDPTMRPRAEVG